MIDILDIKTLLRAGGERVKNDDLMALAANNDPFGVFVGDCRINRIALVV